MAVLDTPSNPWATDQVLLKEFFQEDQRYDGERRTVRRVAAQLLQHLNDPPTLASINLANAPGNSSAMVQAVFLEFASQLGFVSEAKGLFKEYATSGLRPDYFMKVGGTGILLEVERGKTTINNMDLLDFWKCHLCEEANYLFLMVPQALQQNATGARRDEFTTVCKRLEAFFRPRNYTNVRGVAIFGY